MGAGPKYRCKLCGDIVQSMYRHDWKSCKCGEIFIDGGSAYTRLGAKDFDNLEFVEAGPEVAEEDKYR